MNRKKKIGDLLEERAKLITDQRDILDTAETEKRDLSAEDRQKYDGMETRAKEIEGDVKRYQEQQRAEDVDLRGIDPDDPEGEPEAETAERGVGSDEYRDAFNAYSRGQETAEQRTTLNTAADADGGFAVPETWTDLVESLREAGIIRELATVVTTDGGGPLHVPYVSAAATSPDIVAEEVAIPDDGETFAEKVIAAYKLARTTKASEEVVQDALFDVAAFVGSRLGFDLGRKANSYYVNGDAVGEPEGLFAAATVADTLAVNTAIASDEVIDLQYSVIAPYRKNGVYIANDTTLGALRKLKDSTGQYLWVPSLQAGAPDTIAGKPIYADPDVAALAASKKVLGFGDVKRAYMIRDVLGVVIKYLDQTYAGNDQVAWRGKLRTGGAIVDAQAFKVAATPA